MPKNRRVSFPGGDENFQKVLKGAAPREKMETTEILLGPVKLEDPKGPTPNLEPAVSGPFRFFLLGFSNF